MNVSDDIFLLRYSGWGWGAFFVDFDNDGDLDVLNGNGMDDPETTKDARLYLNKAINTDLWGFSYVEGSGGESNTTGLLGEPSYSFRSSSELGTL